MFSEIHQEIKEKDDKKNAAIKIQSFWRGVLTRRKTKIMLKGFRKFQILYREKLQVSIMLTQFQITISLISFYPEFTLYVSILNLYILVKRSKDASNAKPI